MKKLDCILVLPVRLGKDQGVHAHVLHPLCARATIVRRPTTAAAEVKGRRTRNGMTYKLCWNRSKT